jgi:putative transposase
MKLVAQLKLRPTKEQARILKDTIACANAACNRISEVAWERRTFGKHALQKLCYRDVKSCFGLSAQMVVRCLANVGDAYRLDRRSKRRFKPHGSIAYDDRILSWNLNEPSVSIWTVGSEGGSEARQSIAFVGGERQMTMLETCVGETDLMYRRRKFYLLATCEVEDPEPFVAEGVIGVDSGWQTSPPTRRATSTVGVRSTPSGTAIGGSGGSSRGSARTPPDAASRSSLAKKRGLPPTLTT